MLRPINKLSSESFVGVAALLLWTKSEHGKLCASGGVQVKKMKMENGKRTYIDYEIATNGRRISKGFVFVIELLWIVVVVMDCCYYLSMT